MRKSFIPIMFVAVAAMFSCNGKGEQSSLSNGSVWQNGSVIFTDNIAYAFRLKEGEVQLYKAEYVDTADVWKYKFEGKPLETLKKVAAE